MPIVAHSTVSLYLFVDTNAGDTDEVVDGRNGTAKHFPNEELLISPPAQWEESFSKHLWFAFVVVFLAEMGRIPCCGRPESSSSNI